MSSWAGWKRWFTPSRLVPLLTIAGAGTAIVLSLIKVVQFSTAEEIIIALLALVSVDALNERLSILEKIEARLGSLSTEQVLKGRHSIKNPVEEAKYASEICICVIHGASVIFPYVGFYESKLKDGCNIRIILLNPDSSSIEGINLLTRHLQTKQHILSALEGVKGLLAVNASNQSGVAHCKLKNPADPCAGGNYPNEYAIY
jgi:hypothetical protein